MVKTNELRVNNCYYDEDNNLIILSASDLVDALSYGGGLHPVPITHDILERIGFQKYNANIYTYFYNSERDLLDLLRSDGEYYPCKLGFDSVNHYYGSPIRFIHELQNLYFALNRKELDISDYTFYNNADKCK